MGTICSPDHIDPNAVEANTSNKKRPSSGNLHEDASATNGSTTREMSKSESVSQDHDPISPDQRYRSSLPSTELPTNTSSTQSVVIDPALMSEINRLELTTSISRDDPEITNTGDAGQSHKDSANNGNDSDIEEKVSEKQEQQDEVKSKPKEHKKASKSGGFRIMVTRPESLDRTAYSPIPNGVKQTDGTEQAGGAGDGTEEENPFSKKRKQKIDSTLGGAISWRKVADFSALLPRDVKLKLWNGVFKTETDYNQPEMKRISKEYKKNNDTVPNEIKQQLAGAVKEPSKFIAGFLKKEETFIDQALLNIYNSLCAKLKNQTGDETKKAKYAKKAKVTQDNYAELTGEDLQTEFNQHDFLKTAFLQYMLHAYQVLYTIYFSSSVGILCVHSVCCLQIKLDTDSSKTDK